MATDPRLVFRDFNTDGLPDSGRREPPKAEVRTLMLEVYLHPDAYRDDDDAPGDDGPALYRCATAAASLGWRVRLGPLTTIKSVPGGLPTGTFLQGSGPGCIVVGNCNNYLSATDVASITLKDFDIEVDDPSRPNIFTRVGTFRADGIRRIASTDMISFGLRFKACTFIHVKNSTLNDCIWGVYLGPQDGAGHQARCGTCIVEDSWFEHTAGHGSPTGPNGYPAGIYQFECDRLYVDNCDFVNILSGNSSFSGHTGYGVYEGDGDVANNGSMHYTQITNCRARTTEARTDFTAFYGSTSYFFKVANCIAEAQHASGGGYFARCGSVSNTMSFCDVLDSQVNRLAILLGEAGASGTVEVSRNKIMNCQDGNAVIRIGANAATAKNAICRDNTIYRSTNGGIMLNAGNYFDVSGNIVDEVNEANNSFDASHGWKSTCIWIEGPSSGRLSRNRMARISSGHAKYGLGSVASHAGIVALTNDNDFAAMETATVYQVTLI